MANNFPYTNLDANQIIQRSFEEGSDRIRVDAEVTATIGAVECIITAASGDNIAISDGITNVGVTVGGELKVSDSGLASLNAKFVDNYGAATLAIRTASQIGNTTGQANFNQGATTAQTLRTTSNASDGSGNALTSSAYNSNQTLHIQSPDNVTSGTVLGSLNASIPISLEGLNSVGFQISTGTLSGTLVAEASVDGGTTWTNVPFYDPVNSAILTSLVFTSPNATRVVSIVPIGGSSDIRVRVSSYTSGFATGLLRAANVSGASGAITSAAFAVVSNAVVTLTNNIPLLILSANPNRKYAYFGNSSGSTIRLQFSNNTNLSNTTGIPVAPSIGFYELKGDNLFTGDVYAFSSSDVEISVTEGTP